MTVEYDPVAEISPPLFAFPSNTPRINLASPHKTTLSKIRTSQGTVVQSFAIDAPNNHLYTSQLIGGNIKLPGEKEPVPSSTRSASGDIAITKLSLTNQKILGVMHIKGAGHGMTTQIEHTPDGTWLWCDAASSGGGYARALGRVRFQDGAVLNSLTQTTLFKPFGDKGSGLSAHIDHLNNRIMVRRSHSGNARRYYLYDFATFKRGLFHPLATIDQEVGYTHPDRTGVGTFQGAATCGDCAYSLDGVATKDENTTYLTSLSWITGQLIQRILVTHEPGLEYREPEGVDIWVPDPLKPSTVHLGYGFAGGDTGKRHFTLSVVSGTTT